MNLAERILQNRFSVTGRDNNNNHELTQNPSNPQASNAQSFAAHHPPPPPPPLHTILSSSLASPTLTQPPHPKSPHKYLNRVHLTTMQRAQSDQHMKPVKHFQTNHSSHTQPQPQYTRPHSARMHPHKNPQNTLFQSPHLQHIIPPASLLASPPQHAQHHHPSSSTPPPPPPIPIPQSYTPPSYSPNSAIAQLQRNFNPLCNPLSKPKQHYNHPPIKPLMQPGSIAANAANEASELPIGWAKMVDEQGFYYFNAITGAKQRERPRAQRSEPPMNAHQRHLSVSQMSAAEMQYRKKNGSMIFADMINNSKQLAAQENWDMLVDAIYLNLSKEDYVQVFKALRSIAENLFDEDDKYRVLYADNKKVQQRILSRIGGYEFLRGLGFREVTKRKLICDTPVFDVVATAISGINAKLELLEKGEVDGMGVVDVRRDEESVEVDVDVDAYMRGKDAMHEMKLGSVAAGSSASEDDDVGNHMVAPSENQDDEEKRSQVAQTLFVAEGEEGKPGNAHIKKDSAAYSEDEDEKCGVVVVDKVEKETDAGVQETQEYFLKKQREVVGNGVQRKRSLSWDKKQLARTKQQQKEKVAHFRYTASET